MKTIQQKVKEAYFISEVTPVGRIDWAINDYMRTNELTVGEREALMNTSARELAEA